MKSESKKYLVALSKSHFSLMSENEVRQHLKEASSQHSLIYKEASDSWIAADEFTADLKLASVEKRQWYYYQDQKAVGVFNELELIHMVQSKKIAPTQYIWRPGMRAWTEFCRAPEFAAQQLRQLVHEYPTLLNSVFSKRNSPRIHFQADFVVHHELKIWKAQSYEIGIGGMGLQISGQGLEIGQAVKVHMLSKDKFQNFVAHAEIVSHLQDAKKILPDRFGLKFIDIQIEDQRKILQLISSRSSNSGRDL